MAISDEDIRAFYQAEQFLSFYTPEFRLKELKSLFETKSAAEKLAAIKYLDAHMGDVPKSGPDSGRVTHIVGWWQQPAPGEVKDE